MADGKCPACGYLLSEHEVIQWMATIPSADGKSPATRTRAFSMKFREFRVPCFTGSRPTVNGKEVPFDGREDSPE